ncbi:hypothetical protein ABT373_09740 [Streptomyces sp. NPDC000070]|uniref:hypothetical protein n=1 Tax=Streptomyces sp. NPDC000070 TaxID=3154240 RepID=UPI00332A0F2B
MSTARPRVYACTASSDHTTDTPVYTHTGARLFDRGRARNQIPHTSSPAISATVGIVAAPPVTSPYAARIRGMCPKEAICPRAIAVYHHPEHDPERHDPTVGSRQGREL